MHKPVYVVWIVELEAFGDVTWVAKNLALSQLGFTSFSRPAPYTVIDLVAGVNVIKF